MLQCSAVSDSSQFQIELPRISNRIPVELRTFRSNRIELLQMIRSQFKSNCDLSLLIAGQMWTFEFSKFGVHDGPEAPRFGIDLGCKRLRYTLRVGLPDYRYAFNAHSVQYRYAADLNIAMGERGWSLVCSYILFCCFCFRTKRLLESKFCRTSDVCVVYIYNPEVTSRITSLNTFSLDKSLFGFWLWVCGILM